MRKNLFGSIFLLAGMLLNQAAYGKISLQGVLGAGGGTLSSKTQVAAFPTIGQIQLSMEIGSFLAFGLVSSSHKWDVNYREESLNYQGTYSGSSAGVQLGIRFGSSSMLYLQGESMVGGVLAIKSTQSSLINGQTYRYSAYSLYTNGIGVVGTLGFVYDKNSDQFSKDQSMRYGVVLMGLAHSFSDYSLRITTNDSQKTPSSSKENRTQKPLIVAALGVVLGFSF